MLGSRCTIYHSFIERVNQIFSNVLEKILHEQEQGFSMLMPNFVTILDRTKKREATDTYVVINLVFLIYLCYNIDVCSWNFVGLPITPPCRVIFSKIVRTPVTKKENKWNCISLIYNYYKYFQMASFFIENGTISSMFYIACSDDPFLCATLDCHERVERAQDPFHNQAVLTWWKVRF